MGDSQMAITCDGIMARAQSARTLLALSFCDVRFWHKADIDFETEHVSLWHLADIDAGSEYIRSWG